MGQEMSSQQCAAEAHAVKGWPAFMTQQDVQAQMLQSRMHKSLMGRRVRFMDPEGGGGCVEYARLRSSTSEAAATVSAAVYQRVDGACSTLEPIPRFPHALTATEPGSKSFPYTAVVVDGTVLGVTDTRTRARATYHRRDGSSGPWVKVSEDEPPRTGAARDFISAYLEDDSR